MKNLLLTLSLVLFSTSLIAQSNEIIAKSEFFAAEDEYNNSNYQECISHLNTIEALLGSTNPRILHLKIKAYCNLEEYSKAYEDQKKFFELASDPNDPKFNEIVRLLSEIKKNAADNYVEVGKEYYHKSDYTQAISELNKAIEIDPENIGALYYLGNTLFQLNNYHEAILVLTKAENNIKTLENNNEYHKWSSINYNTIGNAYFRLKKYDLALSSYNEVIKVLLNQVVENSSELVHDCYYNIACLYSIKNNLSKSVENLELAIQFGYYDFNYIENDPDLTNILNTNEFNILKSKLCIDERDGRIYKTVRIGSQVWMAENLNFKTDNSRCYNDNSVYCNFFGRLYTWDAALIACPNGWHLSSDEEWKVMEMYLGMSKREANNFQTRGTDEANKLKSESIWNENGNGDNSSGFTALPGGYYYFDDSCFYNVTYNGFWWCSNKFSKKAAWFRKLDYEYNSVYREAMGINNCMSVRCIKDE